MNFSELYQRIKFDRYEISDAERLAILNWIKHSESAFHAETHAAILVYCYSTGHSADNIALIERFLDDDANDYTRSAAVHGLYRIWNLGNGPHLDRLHGFLERALEEERRNTSAAAICCAVRLVHHFGDRRLSARLMQTLETLHEEIKLDNDFALHMFIYACSSIHDEWASRTGQPRIFVDTIEDALPVYWNRSNYSLEQLN